MLDRFVDTFIIYYPPALIRNGNGSDTLNKTIELCESGYEYINYKLAALNEIRNLDCRILKFRLTRIFSTSRLRHQVQLYFDVCGYK